TAQATTALSPLSLHDALPIWHFRRGEPAKIRLVNERRAFHGMQHPIHLHGQRFLVLAVNGVPNADLAWKDTVLVPAGATVDILRSEEHTSELQSLRHLVCRLL